MDTLSFVELSDNELYGFEGGGWFGNALMLTGSVVATFATGPVAVGVCIACAVIGFSDAQGW